MGNGGRDGTAWRGPQGTRIETLEGYQGCKSLPESQLSRGNFILQNVARTLRSAFLNFLMEELLFTTLVLFSISTTSSRCFDGGLLPVPGPPPPRLSSASRMLFSISKNLHTDISQSACNKGCKDHSTGTRCVTFFLETANHS